MSVTLWVDTDKDETIELGPTLPCYAAFAHMARVAGEAWGSEYGALAGVLTQCELQDDADPDWLADVRREAGEFLERFGDALTEDERDILTELAAPPVAKAVVLKGFDEDAHPRDDAGRFISKEDIDAAKADPAKAAELRGRVKPGDEGKLDAALAAAGEPAPAKEEPAGGDPRVAATAGEWLSGADHLPAELKQKYHADLTHALGGMPDAARAMAMHAVNRGGAHFYPDTAGVTQAAASITGRRERGVCGFVRSKAGGAVELHLDSGSETDSQAQYAARGTYAHELWHAVDADNFYSGKPKWQGAYKKDILKGRTLLSRYAMESPTEGFAELGRVLSEKGPDFVRANWPTCYKFFEAEKLL